MDSRYSVEDVLQKGKGIVARLAIAKGELIISEAPVFTVPPATSDLGEFDAVLSTKFHTLSANDQAAILELQNVHPELPHLTGIVKTNALPLGSEALQGGIFPICSRFNHSCQSNAAYSWQAHCGVERVYAMKEIEPGEEITVSYLRQELWGLTQNERQKKIRQKYGFYCRCELCSASSVQVEQSDQRRRQISSMQDAVGDGILIMANPNRALLYCREALRLFAEEGEGAPQMETVYYDAFQVCVAHGDYAHARTFAKLSMKAKKSWEGEDADGAMALQQLTERPQAHRLAGMTTKWRSKIRHARFEDAPGFEEWLWHKAG